MRYHLQQYLPPPFDWTFDADMSHQELAEWLDNANNQVELGFTLEFRITTLPPLGWPKGPDGHDLSGEHLRCRADRDGDCTWPECPQEANGRANYQWSGCPLHVKDPEE